MRRIILWLVAILAVLVGCGGQDRAGRTVVLWHSYTGTERKVLEELIRKFNSTNREGIRVDLLSVAFSNLPDKLVNSIPRGQGPDLFIFAHDRLGDWVDKGLLMPLDYWADPELVNSFEPSKAVEAFIRDGRLYALPLTAKTLVLYVRTLPNGEDPYAEIERLREQDQWSIESLVALARRYTRPCPWDSTTRCYGLGFQVSAYHFAPFLHGFGGTYMTPSCEPTLDTPQMLQAASFFRELTWSGGGKATMPPEMSYSLMAEMFNTGELAMVMSGPWFMSSIRDGVRWRAVTLPHFSGRPTRPFLSIEGIYMSSRARRPADAFEVMRFLISSEAARVRAMEAGQPPVVREVIRSLKNDIRTRRYGPFIEANRTAVPTPSCPEASVVWPPVAKALSAIAGRGLDPATAMEEAQWEVTKYLGACLRR